MASAPTKFLDLDAIASEFPEVTIKLAGVAHALSPVTVEAWIANTKDMQALAVATDIETEIGTLTKMIGRSFKTLTHEMLIQLPLASLNKILEFAKTHNGERKADEEVAADAVANPPATSSLTTSDTSSAA